MKSFHIILLFTRSMWLTAIQDVSSQLSGFAMTSVQSQWSTLRGDSRSTASLLLWVSLPFFLSLFVLYCIDAFFYFHCQICAIIGGTFTVAGIIDSCIFTASEAWKKIQIGKMSWVWLEIYLVLFIPANLCPRSRHPLFTHNWNTLSCGWFFSVCTLNRHFLLLQQ